MNNLRFISSFVQGSYGGAFALVRVDGLWMILVCLKIRGGELGERFEGNGKAGGGFSSGAPGTGHLVSSPVVQELQSAPCLLGLW